MTPEEMERDTSPVRAQIGRDVASRLAAAGVPCASGERFTLWYAENYLGPEDREFLIEEIERSRQPSILLSDDPEQNFRTSDSCNLDRWNERVRAIDRRICNLIGLDERHGETLQGQRYAPGQYFRAHHDFFHTDQSYWAEQQACGGQRTWTAMIFLNVPEAGGETQFTVAGLKALPKPGLLLMWDNMDANGAPNIAAAHEGCAVERGVKYIVTKWFREGNWI
ncbi:2OG-Fe(II) oxygenase [Sphingomonas sp. ID1715]|uniref:prolyl hydroxylase family protein n=1 Tax=Sphingomonas sp. ID1715 TaxID=1656898 RepID=UPI001488FD67|nr:2OG-Fe(II) oxygenase [Sphingomonas sp. ID1715]NNM76774.1 2OG-Fe(II) oxygenase [Sphingomonas sp. ID1715]